MDGDEAMDVTERHRRTTEETTSEQHEVRDDAGGRNTEAETGPDIFEAINTADITTVTDCIIHVCESEKKNIKPCTEDKWRNIIAAREKRKLLKNYASSKYRIIIESLPKNQPSPNQGYHSKCYKNFTAIPAPIQKPAAVDSIVSASPSAHSDASRKQLRSITPPSTSQANTSGILSNECIYCSKLVKKRSDGTQEYPGNIETKQAEQRIREVVHIMKLADVQIQIATVDLISKEAKVHHSCRSEKNKLAERTQKRLSAIQEESQNQNKTGAFDEICHYVNKYVISQCRPELLKSILDRYFAICEDLESQPATSSVQYFGQLLKKRFPTVLILTSKSKKLGVYAHSSQMDYESIKVVYDFKTSQEGQIMNAALLLRRALKGVTKQELSDPLTIESLMAGEGEPPDEVKHFFRILYGGAKVACHSESLKRRALATSRDALFVLCDKWCHQDFQTHFNGMGMKSLAGSRKILTMLNRFGHCINDHAVEELETELAYSIIDRDMSRPIGASRKKPGANAYDNYDELTQTLSGKETLHDTMGIYYGEPDSDEESVVEQSMPSASATVQDMPRKKGRRKLVIENPSITPYRKNPRMNEFTYGNSEFRMLRDTSTRSRKLDVLWMAAYALKEENIPMWVGFNSRFYTDHLPKQGVLYMPNLDRSPTNDDIVAETLRITKRCAEEGRQQYGLVTYDLDVAQRALKIQSTDRPEYDDVFILFGVFHILLCLFRAMGKVIADSGGPEMLVEAGVLASGSMNGFIECGNFSRCKRLHPMLALAFQSLHFRKFFAEYEDADVVNAILRSSALDDSRSIKDLLYTNLFDRLFRDYDAFVKRTAKGVLGETAQFWIQYVEYMQIYHIVERAVRENNVDLFISILTPVTDLFFGTNRHNYAPWMSKYQLDLINIESTHPGLKEMLEAGLFSIRRTDRQCRCSVADGGNFSFH